MKKQELFIGSHFKSFTHFYCKLVNVANCAIFGVIFCLQNCGRVIFCDKLHISEYMTDTYNLLLREFGNGIFKNGKCVSLKDNVFSIIILRQNMRGICCQKSFPFKVHLAFAKHVHQNVTSRMDRSVTHLFSKYQRALSPDLMSYI